MSAAASAAGVAVEQRFELGGHGQRSEFAERCRAAFVDRGEVGHVVDEPRRCWPTPGERCLGEHGAAAMPAQHGDEHVGSGRHPLAAATASHSASSTGQSATMRCQRSAAADGQQGTVVGVGRQQAGPRRQWRRAAPLGGHHRGHGGEQTPLRSRPQGVGDGVGQRAGGEVRRVATVGSEQAHRDQLVPRIGHACSSGGAHEAGIGAGPDVDRPIVEEHGERHDAARRPLHGDDDRPAARRGEQRGDGVATR